MEAPEDQDQPIAKKGAARESGRHRSTAHSTIADYMKTDAQRRAENAYRKKTKQIVVRFYPNDEDEEIYTWLKSRDNVTEYLKRIVREDMRNAR